MPQLRQTIKNTYPLPVYNYRVTIGLTVISFSEVTGLAVRYESITYRHGLSWREGSEFMPGMKQPLQITLKKGLMKNGAFLNQWINTIRQNKVDKHDVLVELCDEWGTPVITWQILKAFPLRLDAPSFNASANEVAIESLELMAGDVIVNFH